MAGVSTEEVQRWYRQAAPQYDRRQRRSSKRFKAVERLLLETARVDRVLDLGCGTGRTLSQLRNPKAVGIDLSFDMLAKGGFSGQVAQADGHHLPFADSSFDAVVAAQAVIRYMRAMEAFAEISRVLRPGGRCAVHQYGNSWTLRGLLGKSGANPLSLSSPEELRAPAREAGLQSVKTQLFRGIRVPPYVIPIPEFAPGAWWNHCILVFEKAETCS